MMQMNKWKKILNFYFWLRKGGKRKKKGTTYLFGVREREGESGGGVVSVSLRLMETK